MKKLTSRLPPAKCDIHSLREAAYTYTTCGVNNHHYIDNQTIPDGSHIKSDRGDGSMLGIPYPSDVLDCKKWRYCIMRQIASISCMPNISKYILSCLPQFRKPCILKLDQCFVCIKKLCTLVHVYLQISGKKK